MKLILLTVVVIILTSGCGSSGPASTNMSSKSFSTLDDKVAFLQKYVRFKRHYHQLDFTVQYTNNSGGLVPGPNEWDVRIVAVVPADELTAWTSGLTPSSLPETGWLTEVPTVIDYSMVTKWFQKGNVVVGVDNLNSVVVYRNLAL